MLQSQLAAVQSSAGDARVLIEADPDSSGGLRYLTVASLANPVPLGSGTYPWFRIMVISGPVWPIRFRSTPHCFYRSENSFLSYPHPTVRYCFLGSHQCCGSGSVPIGSVRYSRAKKKKKFSNYFFLLFPKLIT